MMSSKAMVVTPKEVQECLISSPSTNWPDILGSKGYHLVEEINFFAYFCPIESEEKA